MVSAGQTDSPGAAPRVAVLSRQGQRRFEMFSLLTLSGDRALLGGPLFLEVGERIRLAIDLPQGEVHLEAVVDSLEPAKKAVAVRFPGIPSTEKAKLDAAAGSWG